MRCEPDFVATCDAVLNHSSSASMPAWLHVHRNTVWRGWIETLSNQFSTVVRLVGESAFEVLARAYLEAHKPRSPVLHDFGATLPAFLRGFEPAAQWPWLADVALIDWWWSRAHVAADAQPLSEESFAQVWAQPEGPVTLHPSAHWGWFESGPMFALWLANRWPENQDLAWSNDMPWVAQGGLICRPHHAVMCQPLARGGVVFLDQCQQKASVAQALEAALEAEPDLPLLALSHSLLTLGVFITPPPAGETQ
jgi:hypothetical protein